MHSKHRTDPYAPRSGGQPGVADWRQRMASEPGKALSKQRATAECPNAWARRMGLSRLLVRGKDKARAVLLWFALAHNMLRAFALPRRAVPRQPEIVRRDANSMSISLAAQPLLAS